MAKGKKKPGLMFALIKWIEDSQNLGYDVWDVIDLEFLDEAEGETQTLCINAKVGDVVDAPWKEKTSPVEILRLSDDRAYLEKVLQKEYLNPQLIKDQMSNPEPHGKRKPKKPTWLSHYSETGNGENDDLSANKENLSSHANGADKEAPRKKKANFKKEKPSVIKEKQKQTSKENESRIKKKKVELQSDEHDLHKSEAKKMRQVEKQQSEAIKESQNTVFQEMMNMFPNPVINKSSGGGGSGKKQSDSSSENMQLHASVNDSQTSNPNAVVSKEQQPINQSSTERAFIHHKVKLNQQSSELNTMSTSSSKLNVSRPDIIGADQLQNTTTATPMGQPFPRGTNMWPYPPSPYYFPNFQHFNPSMNTSTPTNMNKHSFTNQAPVISQTQTCREQSYTNLDTSSSTEIRGSESFMEMLQNEFPSKKSDLDQQLASVLSTAMSPRGEENPGAAEQVLRSMLRDGDDDADADERHVTANEESVSICSETEDVCQRFSCKNRIKKLVKENQALKSEMAKLKGMLCPSEEVKAYFRAVLDISNDQCHERESIHTSESLPGSSTGNANSLLAPPNYSATGNGLRLVKGENLFVDKVKYFQLEREVGTGEGSATKMLAGLIDLVFDKDTLATHKATNKRKITTYQPLDQEKCGILRAFTHNWIKIMN